MTAATNLHHKAQLVAAEVMGRKDSPSWNHDKNGRYTYAQVLQIAREAARAGLLDNVKRQLAPLKGELPHEYESSREVAEGGTGSCAVCGGMRGNYIHNTKEAQA